MPGLRWVWSIVKLCMTSIFVFFVIYVLPPGGSDKAAKGANWAALLAIDIWG